MTDFQKYIARELQLRHFDGTGCGVEPDSPGACSCCFGPSPMTADEIAGVVSYRLAYDTEFDMAMHDSWKIFKHHAPAGEYMPTGRLDGDCRLCGTTWPCKPVRDVFTAYFIGKQNV